MITEVEKERIVERLINKQCFGDYIHCHTPECSVENECIKKSEKDDRVYRRFRKAVKDICNARL